MKNRILAITLVIMLLCGIISVAASERVEVVKPKVMTVEQFIDIVGKYKDQKITEELLCEDGVTIIVRSNNPDVAKLCITTMQDKSVRYEYFDARNEIMYTLNSFKSLEGVRNARALVKSKSVEIMNIREMREKNTTVESISDKDSARINEVLAVETDVRKAQDILKAEGIDVIITREPNGATIIVPNSKANSTKASGTNVNGTG